MGALARVGFANAHHSCYPRFPKHQKRRAVAAVSRQLHNQALSPHRRHHAVHTLALLTGHRLHREPNMVGNAKKWLNRAGH
jgi:hypothetical protein